MLVRLVWLTPLLLLSCLDAFAPAGAVPLTPPAAYRVWWTEIERCAGLSGDFDRVEWYQVPARATPVPPTRASATGGGARRTRSTWRRAGCTTVSSPST